MALCIKPGSHDPERLYTTSPDLMRKMRNYFMEQRYGGRWLITYETAQMLTAIMPDLLVESGEAVTAELHFTGGGLPRSVEKFPFEAVVKSDDSVMVAYSGTVPVWFTIRLHPRYTGTDTLNPAKVELMYFPSFNANNEIRTVMIK